MNLSEWTKERIREELKLVGIKPVGVEDYPPAKETGYFLTKTQLQQLPAKQRNAIIERRKLERSGTQEFERFSKAMNKWVEEENERRYQQGLKNGTVLSPEQIEEYMSIIVSRLGDLEISGYEKEEIEELAHCLNITVYKNPVEFDKDIREGTWGYESNNSLTDGTEKKVHILSGDVQPGYEHEILYNDIADEKQTELKDGVCSDFDLSTSQIVAIQRENMYMGNIYETNLNIALYVPDEREYSVDTYKEFVETQGKMTELEQLKSEYLLLKQEQQTIREAEKLIEKANERKVNE